MISNSTITGVQIKAPLSYFKPYMIGQAEVFFLQKYLPYLISIPISILHISTSFLTIHKYHMMLDDTIAAGLNSPSNFLSIWPYARQCMPRVVWHKDNVSSWSSCVHWSKNNFHNWNEMTFTRVLYNAKCCKCCSRVRMPFCFHLYAMMTAKFILISTKNLYV